MRPFAERNQNAPDMRTMMLAASYHLVGRDPVSGSASSEVADAVRSRYEIICRVGFLLSPQRQGAEFTGEMTPPVSYYALTRRIIFMSYGTPCPYYLKSLGLGQVSRFGFKFSTEKLLARGARVLRKPIAAGGDLIERVVVPILAKHGLTGDQAHMLMPTPPRPNGQRVADAGDWQRLLADAEEKGSDRHAAARQEAEKAASRCLDDNSLTGEEAANYLATAPATGSVELWVEHELSIAEAIGRIEGGTETDKP